MEVRINGINGAELTPYRTRYNFLMGRFRKPHLDAMIFQGKGKKRKEGSVDIDVIITGALNFIERTCAKNPKCNEYFKSLNAESPVSLDEILKTRRLDIYRLVPTETATLEDLPAGFTFEFDTTYAYIGINDLMLGTVMNAASVFLHELAHVAGAPGRDVDPKSLAAERALKFCGGGLDQLYDPEAFG